MIQFLASTNVEITRETFDLTNFDTWVVPCNVYPIDFGAKYLFV